MSKRKPGAKRGGKRVSTKPRKPAAPFGKFGAPIRERYLAELANGMNKGDAAANVGVSRELVRLYRLHDPPFIEREADAIQDSIEVKSDKVEDALHEAAISGNVTAQQVWLYNRRPERWSDKRTINIKNPDVEAAIEAELAKLAAGRTAENAGPAAGDERAGDPQPGRQEPDAPASPEPAPIPS